MDYQKDLKRLLGGLLSLILLLFLLSLSSCSTRRAVQRETSDEKVRIEYREIVRTDTVTVQLPPERIEVVRRDSSHLETFLATSDARIEPDGTLYHTLQNKPYTPEIEVRYKDRETIRDSIVYQAKEVPYFVEKELNWWQKLRMNAGTVAIGILLSAIIYSGFRLFRKMKS